MMVLRTSLEAQWLRFRLEMQVTQVQPLCWGTKILHAAGQLSPVPQLLSPWALESRCHK